MTSWGGSGPLSSAVSSDLQALPGQVRRMSGRLAAGGSSLNLAEAPPDPPSSERRCCGLRPIWMTRPDGCEGAKMEESRGGERNSLRNLSPRRSAGMSGLFNLFATTLDKGLPPGRTGPPPSSRAWLHRHIPQFVRGHPKIARPQGRGLWWKKFCWRFEGEVDVGGIPLVGSSLRL